MLLQCKIVNLPCSYSVRISIRPRRLRGRMDNLPRRLRGRMDNLTHLKLRQNDILHTNSRDQQQNLPLTTRASHSWFVEDFAVDHSSLYEECIIASKCSQCPTTDTVSLELNKLISDINKITEMQKYKVNKIIAVGVSLSQLLPS